MIPFIDLKAQQARIRDDVDARLAKVLDHGAYIMGPEVAELESELGKWAKTKHVISCSSGTDALILALMGKKLRAGQGVICPSFTFAASPESIAVLGASPVFADVDPHSFNIDARNLSSALTAGMDAGLEVVGVMAVGLFGMPSDMTAIRDFANKHGLWVIDDAAQSFGASWQDQPVGKLADVTCTSFFPAKPLGCYGDGGALFTDDDEVAEIARSCRVHGMGKTKYHNDRLGMTARLDSMQAAVLLSKLTIFEDELRARQDVADAYTDALGDVVKTPKLTQGATSSWAQYTIKLPQHVERQILQDKLAEKQVPTMIYYPVPMHQQGPYQAYPVANGALTITDTLADIVLALPMHPYLTKDQIITITDAVIAAVGEAA
ncbi:MAG: DegT/DnrJ/EryC1/StrS family aminotransferase [Candidatus Puniceispirillaceae bacterium]